MSHTTRDRQKLLNRVRRIRGQIDGVERLLLKDDDDDCLLILQTIASCRGAINGLMSQVMEGHIRQHVFHTGHEASADQKEAATDLIAVIQTYLK